MNPTTKTSPSAKYRKMAFQIALVRLELPPKARMTGLALSYYMNADATTFVSGTTLERVWGLDKRRVRHDVAELEAAGLLSVQRRAANYGSNVYRGRADWVSADSSDVVLDNGTVLPSKDSSEDTTSSLSTFSRYATPLLTASVDMTHLLEAANSASDDVVHPLRPEVVGAFPPPVGAFSTPAGTWCTPITRNTPSGVLSGESTTADCAPRLTPGAPPIDAGAVAPDVGSIVDAGHDAAVAETLEAMADYLELSLSGDLTRLEAAVRSKLRAGMRPPQIVSGACYQEMPGVVNDLGKLMAGRVERLDAECTIICSWHAASRWSCQLKVHLEDVKGFQPGHYIYDDPAAVRAAIRRAFISAGFRPPAVDTPPYELTQAWDAAWEQAVERVIDAVAEANGLDIALFERDDDQDAGWLGMEICDCIETGWQPDALIAALSTGMRSAPAEQVIRILLERVKALPRPKLFPYPDDPGA